MLYATIEVNRLRKRFGPTVALDGSVAEIEVLVQELRGYLSWPSTGSR